MRKLIAVLFFAVLSAACSESPTQADLDLNIVGTYTLRTVDGRTLPFTIRENDPEEGTVQLTAWEILLGANGVHREIMTWRQTKGTAVTIDPDTITGTWALVNNDITLRTNATGGGQLVFAGTWDRSNQLTFSENGVQFVFRR